MKVVTAILAILSVIAFGLTFGASQLGLVPAPALFTDAPPLTKMADLILMATLVGVVAGGLSTAPGSGGGSFLRTIIWFAPLVGLATFARDAMIIWITVQRTGTTNPRVIAPSVGEALLPLSLGLLIGLLATILDSRRRSAVKAA